MANTAKLFSNGGSQAVRLPVEFRFEGDLVYVRRDERTGDVILSSRPHASWSDFMALRDALGAVPEAADLLSDRPMNEAGGELRDPFREWKE